MNTCGGRRISLLLQTKVIHKSEQVQLAWAIYFNLLQMVNYKLTIEE